MTLASYINPYSLGIEMSALILKTPCALYCLYIHTPVM